jgi:hypothetical protein
MDRSFGASSKKLMPSSRAARMTATPVWTGSRSYVRQEPSDNADTCIPEEPSGLRLSDMILPTEPDRDG